MRQKPGRPASRRLQTICRHAITVAYFRVTTITAEQQKAIGEICRAFSRKLDTGAKPGPFLIELIEAFPDPAPLQKKIIRETRRAFERASQAENPRPILEEILTELCSWGDTIEETDVLSHLRAITESGSYNRATHATNQPQ